MNLHPILVHFPIALLTVYAVMELLRFKKLTSQPYWWYCKALFVIIGATSAVAARQSGELIKDEFLQTKFGPVVEVHGSFATYTTIYFVIIGLIFVAAWLFRARAQFANYLPGVEQISIFTDSSFMIPLALIGLFAISITGALGGIIAFGPDIDPLTKFLYQSIF